jgi:virulence-associated protein VagC
MPKTTTKPKRKALPEGTVKTARVFWSGRSQAVRLPKEFRFDVEEVSIRREGNHVILEPLRVRRDDKGWPLSLWELAGAAPDFDLGDRGKAHERGDVLAPPDETPP